MFSAIWAKIAALSVTVVSILLMVIGYKNSKIERQEEVIHMQGKKAEIIEGMDQAEDKAEKKADEAIEDINTDDWRDRI